MSDAAPTEKSHRHIVIGLVVGGIAIAILAAVLLFAVVRRAPDPRAACDHIGKLASARPSEAALLHALFAPGEGEQVHAETPDDRCLRWFSDYADRGGDASLTRCVFAANDAAGVAACLEEAR